MKNKLLLILILFLLIPLATALTVNDSDVILYYSLDDVNLSGSNPLDLSPNNIDGTNENTVLTGDTGIIGESFLFDGTNENIGVEVNNAVDNLFNGGASISFWIRSDTQTNSDRIWGKNYHTLYQVGNEVEFWQLWNDGSNVYVSWTSSGIDLNNSEWAHIVFTYNDSNTVNDPVMYVNGEVAALTENTAPSGTPKNDSAYDLNFGNRYANDKGLDGKLDEILIIDRILNSTEVDFLYNEGSPNSSQQYPFIIASSTPATPATPVITINQSSLNVTSAYANNTAWRSNIDSFVNTYDNTPTITFNTNITGNCSIGLNNYNYTTMITQDSNTKCSTVNTTDHTCTLPATQILSLNDDYIYLSCVDTNNTNSSNLGGLRINYITVPSSNFSITVNDFYDSSAVNNISVSIEYNGSTNVYHSTSNYLLTNITNVAATANISISQNNYFTGVFTDRTLSTNLTASLKQSDIKFRARDYYDTTEINANITINGSTKGVNESFYLTAGTYTALFSSTGYYDFNSSFLVSPLDNLTKTVSGLYNTIINVSVVNAWTGTAINNFNITSLIAGDYTTTNGFIEVKHSQNNSLSINIISDGFVIATSDITPNSSLYDVSVLVYPLNSVNISFKYYNGTLITGTQINITTINSEEAITDNTTIGYLNLSVLSPDNYEIRTEASNFIDRKYFFTVTNQSTQAITVYITENVSTELQVFQLYDDSNEKLTGAVLRVERETTTGSDLWTNYGEEISNADGKVNTYLEKGINNYYRFVVLIDGVAQKIYPSLNYYSAKTNFIAGVTETINIIVVIQESSIENYYDDLYGVTYELEQLGNNSFYCSWIDAQNTITGATLLIKGKYIDSNFSFVTISDQSSTAQSGNLSYTITPRNNTIYNIECYIDYDDHSVLVDSKVHSYDLNVIVDKNTGLLYAVVILAVTALLTLVLGVMASSVLTFAMLIFTNLVGFTNFPTTIITGLIAIAIILFVRSTKNDEG